MADAVHGSASSAAPHADAAAHGHAHPRWLAHHFDTPVQQFDSGKLGMWLFLATEILLFGGLFCAYAIYRANHPEIFKVGHRFLDVKWGAINTVVLLVSSFTMAWAVHASQRSQKRNLIIGLSLTLLGGFLFMGIKAVEYRDKFAHGTLPGIYYKPQHHPGTHESGHAETPPAGASDSLASAGHAATSAPAASHTPAAASAPAAAAKPVRADQWDKGAAAAAPAGLTLPTPIDPAHHAEGPEEAINVHIFFGIYFTMTGLHGLHVLAGMVVIGWLLLRSIRGDFSAEYFAPVDLGGLYWHLVDLIWIYLFPLLYLIH